MEKDIIKNALKHTLSGYQLIEVKYYSDITGISKTELSEAKRGTRSISYEKALRIATAHNQLDSFLENIARLSRQYAENLPHG